MRGRKLPLFMGGSIGPRMKICETSTLPIPMVPRLHQSNAYIKRNLRTRRVQKCTAQCNGFIKRKLPEWRVQKCIALLGADTVLTSAGPQITPCDRVMYRVHGGNLRNFGPTKPHGDAFAPMQWLYQKEATGMESSKMYCPSRCRYRTYQGGAANYPVTWGAV